MGWDEMGLEKGRGGEGLRLTIGERWRWMIVRGSDDLSL